MFISAVAPMMGYTHRWCRVLYRMLSKKVELYTEMVVDQAVIHGMDISALPNEGEVILQLGGNTPQKMAAAVSIAEKYKYSAYNINVGCPSNKVQDGAFGACLMRHPQQVAEIISAMRSNTTRPVEVKTRLGIDDLDSDSYLYNFLEHCIKSGCNKFILHARKAWLTGLSPLQNRTIPPLQYDRVIGAKKRFPEVTIILNGGLSSFDYHTWYGQVDGVMLGRAVWDRPELLLNIDGRDNIATNIYDIIRQYVDFCLLHNAKKSLFVPPLMGFFRGSAGAKVWRQKLTQYIIGDVERPDVLTI